MIKPNDKAVMLEEIDLEIPWELDAGEIVYWSRSENEWVTLGVRA